MKIRVTFKTPDALFYALHNADLTYDEEEEVKAIAEKFISADEYVTIVIDTETKTASVEEV